MYVISLALIVCLLIVSSIITSKINIINEKTKMYVYNETSTDLDSYMLRYWGDGDVKTADAVCTPLNTTEEVSVGKNYWNNEAKTFYMFTAEIPAEATGFKFHIGDDRYYDIPKYHYLLA